jgi:hypothetical protein
VFDLTEGSEVGCFLAASDTVNGCSFHPVMGLPLLATASGHRRYPLAPEDSDDGAASSPCSSDDEGARGARAARRARSGGGGGGRGGSGGGGGAGGGDALDASCNAIRLWRLRAEWVDCPLPDGDAAMDEAAAAAAAAEGAAAPDYSGIPLVRV